MLYPIGIASYAWHNMLPVNSLLIIAVFVSGPYKAPQYHCWWLFTEIAYSYAVDARTCSCFFCSYVLTGYFRYLNTLTGVRGIQIGDFDHTPRCCKVWRWCLPPECACITCFELNLLYCKSPSNNFFPFFLDALYAEEGYLFSQPHLCQWPSSACGTRGS